jgi:hypothetical protein
LNAVDCPDGLARCVDGNVEASRLATIPQPCRRPPPECACPWERVGTCDDGCVVEGIELVMERRYAGVQLCAPRGDAGVAIPLTGASTPASACDEGQLYRCRAGQVVACRDNAVIGSCASGCFTDQAAIDADLGIGIPKTTISREEAFAILCSR